MKWRPHTRIKLELLKKYFDICLHYHKGNLKKFYYIDTHAGDGYAEFKNKKVSGSPMLAMERGFQCFLIEKNKKLFKKLQNNVDNFQKRTEIGYEQQIMLLNDDCNIVLEKILNKIPPYYHSLFFLDPFAPKDLKWDTVQKIINHEYEYKNPRDMPYRRPEIIINFPISGIKRNAGKLKDEENNPRMKKSVEHVTNFFGSTRWKQVWRKYEIDRNKGDATSEKSRDALKNLYIGKFKEYYQYFHTVLVTEFQSNLPLYYLIYFTNKYLGNNKMRELVDEIEAWKQTTYVHEIYNIIPLDEFYNIESVEKDIQMALDGWIEGS